MRELLALLLKTGPRLFQRPAAWSARQWIGRLGFLALIIWAALEKRWLQAALQGHAPFALAALAGFIDDRADGTSMILYAVALFALAWAVRAVQLRQSAEVFLASGACCLVLWSLGSFLFSERRPLDGGALFFFTQGGHGISGHAAVAALLILPIRDILLRQRSARIQNAGMALAILWVALVSWSRVFLGKHFVWNVLAGFAVGLFCSAAAVDALRELETSDPSHPVEP